MDPVPTSSLNERYSLESGKYNGEYGGMHGEHTVANHKDVGANDRYGFEHSEGSGGNGEHSVTLLAA